ncbi:hypothetical protein J7M28_11295 [bacterium]|nr:hypothetical protein [bacterium]
MKRHILVELELNLAKMEDGMAAVERRAAMGDPVAKNLLEPLAKQIDLLKSNCRERLEQVVRTSTDPHVKEMASEALWRFMAGAQNTLNKTH